MPDSIPNLWGTEIDLDDLSPTIILNAQAAIIQRQTKGLIAAELIQRKSGNFTELYFDIKSHAARHRSRLLECRYLGEDVYPVCVIAAALLNPGVNEDFFPANDAYGLDREEWEQSKIASNQGEFVKIVSQVLQPRDVGSKISSIIAKSNEAKHSLDHLVVEIVASGGLHQ